METDYMRKTFLRALFFTSLFISMFTAADAQATRTWVSGVGDDVNPCSRTAPCKTFAGAISKTAVNGEINCLDSGGFGAVTITKSIVIDCTGTLGGVLAAGTNGTIINITVATDLKKTVILRGLDYNGAGTGINGVRILAASKVFIEKTILTGFTQNGVSVENTTPVQIFISDCTIRNNSGSGVGTFSTNTTEIAVSKCVIGGNGTGILAAANATFRITGNSIMHNVTGLSARSGGKIVSFKDNAIDGNGTNGVPTSTVALQ